LWSQLTQAGNQTIQGHEFVHFLQGTVLKTLQRAVTLAQEKDASSWLTMLPVQEYGFSLHKTTFKMPLLEDMAGCHPVHQPTIRVAIAFSVDMSKRWFPLI